MKRPFLLAAITSAAALILGACSPSSPNPASSGAAGSASEGSGQSYSIGITQITTHPSLDAARDGFKQAFADAGIEVTFDEQNAQGDQATATSIASKFAGSNLDLVLAIATPAAQAAAQAILETPILFTAVTDPVSAQLVDSLDTPGSNITGTTDMNPVADQIALIKDFAPAARNVGILYSSGEVNSEVQVEIAKKAAQDEGLTVVETTVTNSSEVQQTAQDLASKVDAIYVPTDNTVVSAFASVVQAAEDAKIPLIAGEGDSVMNGGLATYGIDYFELGRQTGEMAIAILSGGADPATMPVQSQSTYVLSVNTTTLKALGLEMPARLADKARTVK